MWYIVVNHTKWANIEIIAFRHHYSKVLKESLRKRYVNDCLKTNKLKSKKHNNRMGWRDLQFRVCNHERNLFNSFKYSAISCSLDSSEDDMFWGYEDLYTEAKL